MVTIWMKMVTKNLMAIPVPHTLLPSHKNKNKRIPFNHEGSFQPRVQLNNVNNIRETVQERKLRLVKIKTVTCVKSCITV